MRVLLGCLFVMALQIGINIFIVTPDYTRQQITYEIKSIHSSFGHKLAVKVIQRSNNWLAAFFSSTELPNNLTALDYLRQGPANLNLKERVHYARPSNLQTALYQVLLRLSLLSFWAPLILVILVICAMEGISQRKARKTTFAYSTVERNRVAIRAFGLILMLLVLGCCCIVGLPAISLLVASLALAIALMLSVASAKRSL